MQLQLIANHKKIVTLVNLIKHIPWLHLQLQSTHSMFIQVIATFVIQNNVCKCPDTLFWIWSMYLLEMWLLSSCIFCFFGALIMFEEFHPITIKWPLDVAFTITSNTSYYSYHTHSSSQWLNMFIENHVKFNRYSWVVTKIILDN
jgi:hypothetical protein